MDTIDLYQQRYLSFNLPKTLFEHFRDRKSLFPELYTFLIDQAYNNGHFELYKKLFDEAESEKAKISRNFDKSWYEDKRNQFYTELAKKEAQLASDIKSNIKPSIQASYIAIAKMYINSGSYADFEKSVLKANDIMPGNPDVLLFLKIAALYNGKFDDVRNIISKYEDSTTFATLVQDHKHLYIYGRAIQGLLSLKYREYHLALNSFLEVNPENLPFLGLFTSLQDLAKYLAVFSVLYYKREDIKSKVLSGFPKTIINQSNHASKFLDNYLNANYEDMIIHLNALLNDWDNDKYVHGSRNTVFDNVMERAVKQFLLPLKKVKIDTVANLFNITILQTEEIVKILILTKQLKAKIDKVNKIIILKETDDLSREYLVNKASNIVSNYCFEKQFAVLKVGFNVLANARHKNKSIFEQND